ncbi:MAG: methyltransferase domain-containing protein [Treponema sp.]|jgi:2-polyprenyl-3-methyl-5-hydroxy-6-metoxy-1,4-benzoquinol methylase/spore coat polysaccharide biosynthesis predicted glycosyltransferase SpsG|nr:methyltransferase domain-containing protein [Treponema sp.]
MSRGPVLAVPALGPGRGGGHLIRCLALVRELRALGREARLFLGGESGDLSGIFNSSRFDSSWLIAEAEVPLTAWDFIVLDRFQTPPEEFSCWAGLAPLAGIDEGGPCRDRFDFLVDILPGLPNRSKPNIADPSLLPLPSEKPPRRLSGSLLRFAHDNSQKPLSGDFPERLQKKPQAQQAAGEGVLKVLISFGHEDAAGLGLAAAKALTAKNNDGMADITLLSGGLRRNPLSGDSAQPGIHALETIPDLGRRLADYDMLITHYGLTAFEAIYAGTPVLLVSPGAYHEKLAKAAGFFSAGTGTRGAAKIPRLLFKKNALDRAFLQNLEKRRAVLAVRHTLERKPKQSLAGLLAGFSPAAGKTCPVCGEAARGAVFGRGSERGFRRCRRCGVIFMNRLNPPPIEYGREYFFELYQKQYGKTYIEDFPNLTAAAKRRLSRIKLLLPAGGQRRLLDIGCAYGPFLAAAREEGFSPIGIDPAEDAVRYVTQTLGIPAVQGFFPGCRIPGFNGAAGDARFDAVTLWYVIEHFQNCVPVLAAIRRILKPGGVLSFSSPSFTGISGRLSLKRFLAQSPADHWTIWSPAMCRKALARAGFKVMKIVISGHHPERFPGPGKFAHNKKNPLYAVLLAASKIFALGDTFEVYALATGIKKNLSAKDTKRK